MKTFKKIIDLLTPQEFRHLFFILIMTLVMGLLDLFGVISILPFIAILSKPELIETNAILAFAFDVSKNFGVNTVNQFLFILALFSFLMLVFSSSFKALTVYVQHKFAAMREYSLSRRLLEGYLRQPYVWFLNKNSGELGKNILSEVNRFTNYCLFPMINLISNSIIASALISLIIFIDPIVAFMSFVVLGASYIIIYKSVSLVIKKIGNKSINSNEGRYKILHELFGAIKELKVRGLEQTYIDRYSLPAQTYANTIALSQIIGQLPRFFIEIIAFGGIIILILFLLNINNKITEILPIIVLYVFAAYKLIPALQSIYHAYSNIKFSKPGLKALHRDIISLKLEKSENNKLSPFSLKQNIELKNIYFTYPDNIRPALNNITMTIPAKSIIGLVGSTGGGKTTLVDIITGLLKPQKGTLMVNGKDIFKDNLRCWQKIIGYVPQNIYLSDDTVSANIAFGLEAENIDFVKVCKSAKNANIHDFIINELSESYNTIVGERGVRLSGGQRQRLGIARAIYHEPELLIFDEATNALDGITESVVMEAVKKLRKNNTIIIIAHRLTTVRDCDNIFLIENGELVDEGTFEKLSKNNKKFSTMLNAQ